MECKDIKPNKNPQSFTLGFSLIELLVVISISIIIMSLGYANYTAFGRKKTLEKAVSAFKSDLIFAREYALSGKKPAPGVGACDSLESYEVRSPSSRIYEIWAICDNNGSSVEYMLKTTTLPIRVTFSSFPSAVTFRVLGRGVVTASDITIVLRTTGASNQTVTISPSGQIR
jgi:prepilin-type N-terminal cleavage/methylation domain-containing protein